MPIVRHPRRRPAPLAAARLVTAAAVAAGIGWYALQPSRAAGTISLTGAAPYTQNFDTLASTGTANTTVPTGWEFSESGSNANTTYRAGTGSDNTGDTYSFGATANPERAFGGLRSGSLVPLVGAQFTNGTGATITSLTISYTGEQWRLGQNGTGRAADRLDFQLSTNATSITTGTWVDYNGLDVSSPVVAGTVGALDGNASANRLSVSSTITNLSIPNGATFWIRWADTDLIPGADDGLAIDDFTLTPTLGVPTPTLSITDQVRNEGDTGTQTYAFTVTLSTPAGPGGVTFDIATADNTAQAPTDYVATALTLQTIPEGSRTYTFDVLVNGDTGFEPTETFFVNVTNVTGATVSDGQGTGTITNDDVDCGGPATPISAIQGSGLTSPLVGQVVTIEGIVTADSQGTGQFGGYFVQEDVADEDGDPATSEGLFVFDTSRPVDAGQRVRVTGVVTEFMSGGQPLTELTNVSSAGVCGTGASVTPVTVTLPVDSVDAWERFEGMRVSFTQPLVATDVFTLARFGEVELSLGARLPIPTHAAAPGAAAQAVRDGNLLRRIVLDDGNNQQNIDPTIHPVGGLSAVNTLRVGSTVSGLTGVLDHRFGAYRVQPVGPVPFTATNPRPAQPAEVGGSLTVASFNVLNYFNGDGAGGGFPTSRGATTAAEFARQRAKTVAAIVGTGADVIGLMELENDFGPGQAIEDLVAGLNDATAPGTYAFIDTGVIGGDEIRVGLVYKPAAVSPVGNYAVMTSSVDPAFIDTLNRPSLAQTFREAASGGTFTVVVNHLKSKGSDCAQVGDPDTGDLQGNCNLTRTRAAEALVRWLATDPTGAQDTDVLLIGDMNSYRLEDPITAFRAGGYQDLQAAAAYSYVFDGESGYLDHALASPSLAAQVTGVTEWHINADEPLALDYNVEFKSAGQVASFYAPDPFRSSDHDPVVIGLALKGYAFTGLQRPVGRKVVKAGSSLPLVFGLGGDRGLDIFAAGYPASAPIACDETGGAADDGQALVTAGRSTLQYDPLTDRYTFVWKTARAWAGTCRQLTLRFTDGSWYRVEVAFQP
ncbi:hypothetical protein TBR22_A14210 [Luteitalea sp. TBR-22]|uniref:ExeM/NucH family extracellular endonuclease n=1 Tax=Luteitalea sp. TBR-22 TaxID=2802971 RepID=UPI001AF27A7C|nr:ExeM/NucH family extracellular endonuclease [Luteitalea sp. TBR-22]BCS32211.1 hypothetical protein TBR22_A14210 [Luteitalea sp. TBR-22]